MYICVVIKADAMEMWKDVVGYDGYYQVSNIGRVKRLASSPKINSDRILKNKKKKSGYLFVCLSKNGDCKYFHVHRLVGNAFITNPRNKPCINHKDLDKSNNIVSNLEWVTIKENNSHARKNKKFKNGVKKGVENNLSKPIAQFKDGVMVYLWGNASEINIKYDICISAIGRATRECKTSIGYEWKYVSKKYYIINKHRYTKAPTLLIDKRYRDTKKAQEARKRQLSEKYTNEILIKHGVRCFIKYGSLIRKYWDKYAKENKVLTYIPVSNRFYGFKNFKKQVSTQLLQKANLPI